MIEASTVPGLLSARADLWSDRELLRYEGKSATYAEVEERSNHVARTLARLGAGHGSRVAVMLPNGLEWPIVAVGVWKLGAIVVPVNVTYGTHDLSHILRDSGAILAVTDRGRAAAMGAVRESCPALGAIVEADDLTAAPDHGAAGPDHGAADPDHGAADPDHGAADPDHGAAGPGPASPAAEDPATLQYTSGTTGFPKGCILTHRYWLDLARNICRHVSLGEEDVALTAQPFYYMDPTWNLVACMHSGAPLVVLPRFSPSTFWSSVKDNGVTYFYCLGTMPVYLFKQPENPDGDRGHAVRVAICSGIPPHLHESFERRWGCPLREAYGTTEIGGALVVPLDDADSVGTGAMGREVEGYEARVVDAEGAEVRDGERGELQFRGGSMMSGYWNQPEATRDWNPDGWVRTGDLVFRDPRGYYHMAGRLKDMIRRGGENIAAAEVESVLCDHPAVAAAACVPVPDEERGEEVKAYVQLLGGPSLDGPSPDGQSPGELPPADLPPADLLAFAAERLARFKLPRYVEYVTEFPLTPSERIAKHELLAGNSDPRVGAFDAREGVWR